MKGSKSQPDDASRGSLGQEDVELLVLKKDCSRMSVPENLSVGLVVMIRGGMNRKRIQRRAWPCFTF